MESNAKCRFFLGANTQDGFCSRFGQLRNIPQYRHQYIIKGGPGSGKSTLMRRIAQAAEDRGYTCERILCSSDTFSLDGVIVWELGLSFVDGTAPHVVEPRYAGACESYIDLSPYWDMDGLSSRKTEIIELDASIKTCYRNAYGHLRCAGIYEKLLFDSVLLTRESDLHRRISGLLKREIPKAEKDTPPGKRYVRYLSGYTPTGISCCTDTVYTVCDRLIGLYDDFGSSAAALADCADAALRAGLDVYDCLDPLYSENRTEHVLIPSLRLGFVRIRHGENLFSVDKRINLNPYVQLPDSREAKQNLKSLRLRRKEAIEEGISQIAQAKQYHDLLEQTYRPYIDFKGIENLTKECLSKCTLL